jgi:hypothetical protein
MPNDAKCKHASSLGHQEKENEEKVVVRVLNSISECHGMPTVLLVM